MPYFHTLMQVEPVVSGGRNRFLEDGGEMGALTRSYDWSNSPLGPPETWPLSLRTTLGILLHSSFPMFLFWGEDLICFYNDAYRPSLGMSGKHPALGKKGREVWPDIWHFIGPLIEQVMRTGQPVWYEDQYLPIFRNGRMEDVYWTFSYSPAYGDNGSIQGVFVTCTETTKTVESVRKLAESERRFQTLVRDSPVGIIVLIGAEYRVEIVNDAYGLLIDRKAEELRGKDLFEVIPEAAPYFRHLLDGVRQTGIPYVVNDQPYFVWVEGQKKEGFLNIIYQPYREEGKILGVMALLQDVTDAVLARRKLEESEQRVRALVESAPFPMAVYEGRELRIALANAAIIGVYGKGSDVIGKRYTDILPELANQAIFDQLYHVYDTGEAFHARNQRVDIEVGGAVRTSYYNYSFTPLFDAEGNVYGIMNTGEDVTDLNFAIQRAEQSERNFRNMILQSPVAMCILLGPEHVIDIANEAMIELWGKPADEVRAKPVFEALPDARAQGLEELLDHVYRNGETFVANERPVNLIRRGIAETTYQNFVYEPYRDASGAILGVLATSVDVTEQVLARQRIEEVVAERTRALASANENLQRSNAELAQFAFIASHDLQEPVRKVSTFTQMLEQHLGEVDARARNYLEKIKYSSTRMLALIRDVLAYSELSRPRQAFAPVNLEQVFEEIRTDYELLIEQEGARLHFEGLPTLEAIPLHMSQLFGNLVSNALKFRKPGLPPEVQVSAEPLTAEALQNHPGLNPDQTYYRIVVQDNGIGFSQEHAQQIFQIFQRLHGRREYEGTGIGLALCLKIVQNHHGLIYAESTPGQGSRFTVILPERQNPS